jgi:deazaflavin-dependent oxidoreductase (nitroreductase family)
LTVQRERPSRLLKLGFKVPVWLYQAHLGFIFGGRIFMVVHHGRATGKRYISGLEVLTRRGDELFVFSAYGRRADWLRNIEAGGVDELWAGRRRYPGAEFRLLEPDEAVAVLASYEREHPRTARQTLTRMLPGYDGSDEMRRQLAETGTLVAFRPTNQDR